MKRLCLTAILTLFSTNALLPAMAVNVSASNKEITSKKIEKKKTFPRKKKDFTAVMETSHIPENTELWTCANGKEIKITGHMKLDAVLTMSWKGKNYKLLRQESTTGANRFHDVKSGLDLVVIPTKAMLFSKQQHGRLADECMTHAMDTDAKNLPIQSNALLK
ncbi:hypothetical protein [Candidatus Pandoraea novymonadis]|uniref:Uncharacterized protein n=1 Tax=Candidatus Pandoraea novymonadis TaxID=1808959 RepID=A0ABX5FFN0_9BURK|nr:hypothetical protein [Candidatus Pandoraea novymonadis]PSB92161.1 hypothetical protein BZL35_00392 [Candidatus Pandoraea novymonadis]